VISVVLPYRDASDTLAEATVSVLADMGPDDELIAVDDGSVDGSAAEIAALAAEDRRVVQIATSGVGIARALEAGVGRASTKSRFLARMDADDVSLPGRFAAERALLEDNPSFGVVATEVEIFGAPGPGMERYVAWQNSLRTPADHARSIFVESPICHPSTMIRRAALDAVGGFHDGMFAEDYDLWLRLAAAGWGIAKVPRVLFRWRIRPTSVTFRDPRLSTEALRRLRARHLAAFIGPRSFAVWGAGPAGRRLTRELETHGGRARFFIDIDPRKIGRTARGVPILAVDEGVARAREERLLLVVAVATLGARDLVRTRLAADDLVEGEDFVCAA
jgi:glycosyltransferase involved in cell wall biosynthesis